MCTVEANKEGKRKGRAGGGKHSCLRRYKFSFPGEGAVDGTGGVDRVSSYRSLGVMSLGFYPEVTGGLSNDFKQQTTALD